MPAGADLSQLNDLIGSIYDASMENSDWAHVAKAVFRLLGAHAGQLWSPFVPAEQGGIDAGEVVVDPSIRADYAAYFHRHDLWYQRSVERGYVSNGKVITDRELVTEREFRRSEFWVDFLRKTDCYRMCTGIVADGSSGDLPLVALTLFRGARAPEFGRTEERVVARLLPHLRRALMACRKIAPIAASSAELALERLAIPVLVLARDATVLLANPAAERVAMASQTLRIRQGRLRLSDGEAQRRLEELLRHAATGFAHLHWGTPSVFCSGDPSHDGLILSIVPLRGNDRVTNPGAVAMLLLRTAFRDSVSKIELKSVYGLTTAEATLAVLLVRGDKLEDIAGARAVSMNTVRTQLRHVLQKTGTSRQADLIRLLLSRHMPLA